MGHLKEPVGVDFVINSRPLTKKEETGISEYIREYKAKSSHKTTTKRTSRKTFAKKDVEA